MASADHAMKCYWCRSEGIFRWDALLLTGIEDFSTAGGNARDTFGDNAPATEAATRRHSG
jgi:hypothetical protein